MNKATIITLLVLALIVAGAFAYSQSNKSQTPSMMAQEEIHQVAKDDSEASDTAMKDEEPMETDNMQKEEMTSETEDEMNSSGYVEYNKSEIDQISGRRVLFFYANWCPTCRPADADFKSNAETFPADLTVTRVNYNDPDTDRDEKNLAEKYGVTYQHTFVQIDDQGQEIAKWNGGQSKELLANIK